MEENNSTKRKRSPNYTNKEKSLLLNIVAKHKNVVLNQKTDATSCEEKDNAWKCIADEFNAQSPAGIFRDAESLHRLFLNAVQTTRKIAGEERKELYLTGGGRKKPTKKDDNYELMLDLINTKTVQGLANRFDNDVIAEEDNGSAVIAEFEVVPESDSELFCIEPGMNATAPVLPITTWKKAADLTKKKTGVLKPEYDCSRRRPAVTALTTSHVAERYEKLLDMRLAIAEVELARVTAQSKFEAEEQELRLKRSRMETDNMQARMQFEENERKYKLTMMQERISAANANYYP